MSIIELEYVLFVLFPQGRNANEIVTDLSVQFNKSYDLRSIWKLLASHRKRISYWSQNENEGKVLRGQIQLDETLWVHCSGLCLLDPDSSQMEKLQKKIKS